MYGFKTLGMDFFMPKITFLFETWKRQSPFNVIVMKRAILQNFSKFVPQKKKSFRFETTCGNKWCHNFNCSIRKLLLYLVMKDYPVHLCVMVPMKPMRFAYGLEKRQWQIFGHLSVKQPDQSGFGCICDATCTWSRMGLDRCPGCCFFSFVTLGAAARNTKVQCGDLANN